MKELDPGHLYIPDSIDGEYPEGPIRFVKREGDNYPGNVGHYPGTTIQEVLRILIARLCYVNGQTGCNESCTAINLLRETIQIMEMRAKRVKGKFLETLYQDIETYPPCKICGNILCTENH